MTRWRTVYTSEIILSLYETKNYNTLFKMLFKNVLKSVILVFLKKLELPSI